MASTDSTNHKITVNVDSVIQIFKDLRRYNKYSNTILQVLGRDVPTEEAQAILIHLAKTSLDKHAEDADIVLASWGLLRGFEVGKLNLTQRRELYVTLVPECGKKPPSLDTNEKAGFRSIAERCIELVKNEDNLDSFIKTALKKYCGKDKFPTLSFLEVEDPIPETPVPEIQETPASEQHPETPKKMTKRERAIYRMKHPEPLTKWEIVGMIIAGVVFIIFAIYLNNQNQEVISKALALRAANSTDTVDFLQQRLQQDILSLEYEEDQLAEIQSRAENGDAEAQYILGAYNYMNYQYKKAEEWLRLAAEQGYAYAQTMLANQYIHGYGVEVDYDEAFTWALRAAEQGDGLGQTLAGCCYAYGWGVDINLEEAAKWYSLAADQNEALAINNLGSLYFDGTGGVKQSYAEALRLFMQSYDLGCPIAAYNIACMYQNGVGVEKDTDLALEWCRIAAEGGYAPAQAVLDSYE